MRFDCIIFFCVLFFQHLVQIVAAESSQQIYDLLSEIIKWEPRQVIFLEELLSTINAEVFFGLFFFELFLTTLFLFTFSLHNDHR